MFVLYGVSLVGLLAGRKTRLFAVCAWLLHGLTVNSGYISLYGVDTMPHICLFYCVWMPFGDAFSLRQILRRESAVPSFMARISLRALQVHLCIVYFSAGLAKLKGEQWRNGEALWRALMQPRFSVFDMPWLASMPLLVKAACRSVVLLELAYAFLIRPEKFRRIWLAGITPLHLSTGIFMGVWMFSTIMMIMNFTALGFTLLPQLRNSGELVTRTYANVAPDAVPAGD